MPLTRHDFMVSPFDTVQRQEKLGIDNENQDGTDKSERQILRT